MPRNESVLCVVLTQQPAKATAASPTPAPEQRVLGAAVAHFWFLVVCSSGQAAFGLVPPQLPPVYAPSDSVIC